MRLPSITTHSMMFNDMIIIVLRAATGIQESLKLVSTHALTGTHTMTKEDFVEMEALLPFT
jgi:hypothetical protein